MADKEEIAQNNRIINAEKYKRRIKKGRIYIEVRDKKLNCLLSKVYSRQEVIERMAKAICASNMAPDCLWECETCDRWKGSDKEATEAALNSLLGVEK